MLNQANENAIKRMMSLSSSLKKYSVAKPITIDENEDIDEYKEIMLPTPKQRTRGKTAQPTDMLLDELNDEQDALIQKFIQSTHTAPIIALQYLNGTKWDLQAAIDDYVYQHSYSHPQNVCPIVHIQGLNIFFVWNEFISNNA